MKNGGNIPNRFNAYCHTDEFKMNDKISVYGRMLDIVNHRKSPLRGSSSGQRTGCQIRGVIGSILN